MKPVKTYPEYTKLQKERIVKTFLEFYKDGKYQFDENKKKQSQGYYNAKNEILKTLDIWCEEDSFVKYLIPLLDYTLECDQGALEDEWVKNHKLQIALADTKDEIANMKRNWDQSVKDGSQALHLEWVTDKEDIMNLQNALDESEQKRIASVRRCHVKIEGVTNKLDNSMRVCEQYATEVRELRTQQCEDELARSSGTDEKSKLRKEIVILKSDIEKMSLLNDKIKMENELFKMKNKVLHDELSTEKKSQQLAAKQEKDHAKAQARGWATVAKSVGSMSPSPSEDLLLYQD
tara:strand:+ start:2474 stop:3346 length:873 start_codon:yes stop_codon:yes gene_type:complete